MTGTHPVSGTGTPTTGSSPATLRLTADGPIDREAVLLMLRNHAVPGAELLDHETGRHTRLLTALDTTIPVTVTVHDAHIDVEVPAEHAGALPLVGARTRRWFDLDTDLGEVRTALGDDPLLGPLVAGRPELRVTLFPDAAEAALIHVLGQQVSMGAARTFAGRLVAALGTPGPLDLTAFPSSEVVAAVPVDDLRAMIGITNARARTVSGLARALADGLVLDAVAAGSRTPDPAALARIRTELLALPGIGPWTADSIAVRVLGDRDGFPAGDLVLRRALGVTTPRAAEALAERWRPWRAYALFHAWFGAIAPVPPRPSA